MFNSNDDMMEQAGDPVCVDHIFDYA